MFVHIFFLVPGTGNGENNSNMAMDAMYLCLMCFFIIAGYFFRPGLGFVKNMKKRVLQIVVPMSICIIVLPLILFVWLIITNQPEPFSDYINNVWRYLLGEERFLMDLPTKGATYYPMMIGVGYYFLMVMVGGFAIFYAIGKYCMQDNRVLLISIVILLIITAVLSQYLKIYLPYFVHMAPLAAAFMLLGAWLGKNKIIERLESGSIRCRNWYIAIVLLIVADVALLFFFSPGQDIYDFKFGHYGGLSAFPFFIEGAITCFLVLCLANLISKIPHLSTGLATVGTHTLAILLLHEFAIKLVVAPFFVLPTTQNFPLMPLECTLLAAVAAIAICLIIAILEKKILTKAIDNRKGSE